MQATLNMRPSPVVWICLTAVLLVTCASPAPAASDLFSRYAAVRDQRGLMDLLGELTFEEILSLCNDTGADYDAKSKNEEGLGMLFGIMLREAARKASIRPELLLAIAQDKGKSTTWRSYALHFSSGRDGVVSHEWVAVEKTFPICLGIIQDAREPARVRHAAVSAAREILTNAYRALAAKLDAQGPTHLSSGKNPLHRATFDTPEWRRLESLNEEFSRACVDLLGSASFPPMFKVIGVARALVQMAGVRGAQTPGLAHTEEAMRKLLASEEAKGWDEDLRHSLQACADSIRELLGDAGERHE